MEQLILETRTISKTFQKQQAVNQVSLVVPEGSVYGLLGPNGAGKSTLLKMIAGILRPTSGEIIFCDHKWDRKNLRQIGSLIETPPIYDNLTAWENLKVRTLMLGLPDNRIAEVLHTVDLENTGKKRAGQFSMGMKQRLGIAIALLNHPKLLILDEPTNGLDPFGIQQMREMIQGFPKAGISVIISSHILSEIEQMVDYIGIIADGVLGYQGKIPKSEKLEDVFMRVVSQNRRVEI